MRSGNRGRDFGQCDAIEGQPSWVLVLYDADGLMLSGVGASTDETKSLASKFDRHRRRGLQHSVLKSGQ